MVKRGRLLILLFSFHTAGLLTAQQTGPEEPRFVQLLWRDTEGAMIDRAHMNRDTVVISARLLNVQSDFVTIEIRHRDVSNRDDLIEVIHDVPMEQTASGDEKILNFLWPVAVFDREAEQLESSAAREYREKNYLFPEYFFVLRAGSSRSLLSPPLKVYSWIQTHVRDQHGNSLGNRIFSIVGGDGSTRKVRTDEEGNIALDNLPIMSFFLLPSDSH